MNQTILSSLRQAKEQYEKEGLIILGIFGSYARNEETPKSDVDVLYEITDNFRKHYVGLDALGRLAHIREELEQTLGKHVDIADKSALTEVGRNRILPELHYV